MIGGVCGGLGRHLKIDSVLIRLAFVLLTLYGGVGPLIYLVLLILMPLDSDVEGKR
jgi:phage shock protein C